LRPALLAATAAAGYDLVIVDPDRSLADQGPFDVLLHKIRTAGERAARGKVGANGPLLFFFVLSTSVVLTHLFSLQPSL